ncbi:putative sulfate/molybdate transporter [Natrialbaceae archaeon A-CW3]
MALSSVELPGRPIEFTVSEVTGAIGDSVTVLPLIVALAATTDVSLAHIFVGFGVFQIVWGLVYGMPMSLEPMKALVGLAIVGSLSAPELAGAGLLAGAALLVAGRMGLVGRLEAIVGEPVVRGIQLAVALLLLEAAFDLSMASVPVALLGIALVVGLSLVGFRRASALVVLAVGGAVAVFAYGVPTPRLPALALFPSGVPALTTGALEGTVAQLGMTLGNAAIATALLSADLYDRRVSPDDLAQSMGATCLAAIPVGGLPMCHGSGGLAGKYAFGARTAGANVILGGGYLVLALVVTGGLLAAFPLGLLGVLLAVVAFELGRSALAPIAGSSEWAVVIGVALVGAFVNIGVALVVGLLAWLVLSRASAAK